MNGHAYSVYVWSMYVATERRLWCSGSGNVYNDTTITTTAAAAAAKLSGNNHTKQT